jgi:chloramphenicol 3-O-phosphotransferase
MSGQASAWPLFRVWQVMESLQEHHSNGRRMKLIFLYGMPASGKLTVARELASVTGYKVFHNHLAVDLLLSVFEFGSRPFVELREEIWLSVFREACRNGLPGLIFTFAPEATVTPEFVANAQRVVADGGGEVEFVELVCPMEELKRRMDSASRRSHQKLTSVELFEQLHRDGSFDALAMPTPRLTIDTSVFAPGDAAREIALRLELPEAN